MATDTDPGIDAAARIRASWRKNADAWTDAVRRHAIESRRRVTDQAIVDTVMGHRPAHVIDLGCGEGWLARRLAEQGVDVLGVDGEAALIAKARETGGARFETMTYADVATGGLDLRVDVVVCNFSLLDDADTRALLARVPELLTPDGRFVLQTLHPVAACGEAPYRDGWREGAWTGFGPAFCDPAPWYFRTLGGWLALLCESGLLVQRLGEPLHPDTGRPASLIIEAVAA